MPNTAPPKVSKRIDDDDPQGSTSTRDDDLITNDVSVPQDPTKSSNYLRQGSSRTRTQKQDPTGGNRPRANPGAFSGNSAWGADPWADPWADPFANSPGGWGGGGDRFTEETKKQMTPAERVTMIEKVYQDVLGRKPDTRDINYYKYSTLLEDEIIAQLLTGKEHSQLIEDGREYKKIKDRAEQAEGRVKMLEGQIKDQLEEFRGLTELLEEKNRLIQQMRREQNNPYSFEKNINIIKPDFVQNHQTGTKLTPDPEFETRRDEVNINVTERDHENIINEEVTTESELLSSDVQFSAPVFNGDGNSGNKPKRKRSLIDRIIDIFSVQ